MKDEKSLMLAEVAFAPVAIAADETADGLTIDLQGYNACTFVLASGVITTGTLTPIIQEGDESDLSDAAAVADADLVGTEADAAFAVTDDAEARTIGYKGIKRYVRIQIVSASSAAALFGAVVIKGVPHLGPPEQATV